MHKIFKYEVKDGQAVVPVDAAVIRQDYVNDGFYKGDFVWAIVDPDQETTCTIDYEQDMPRSPIGRFQPMKVKEKQKLFCGTPVQAHEMDGEIGVRVGYDDPRVHDIAVYKTGQEIDLPIEKLSYLGLNRLWIVQELGLYTFLVQA